MTTYLQYENSVEAGQPMELYKVTSGPLPVIALTSGDQDILHAGNTYVPSTLKRSEVSQSQDINKASLTLTCTKNNPIAELFRTGPPTYTVFITIFRQHSGENNADFVVLYKGRINACRFTKLEAELACDPIFTSLKRPGLRIKYEPTCSASLYDQKCKLNKATLAVAGSVYSTDGRKVFRIAAAANHPNGYFTGGMLLLNGGLQMIGEHTGDMLVLVRHTIGSVGDAATIYPGCDHTRNICHTRFNNINNFRGFPWMADRNPFVDRTITYIN
jgi:uncharacterized phage protein (TIGR02218 family)